MNWQDYAKLISNWLLVVIILVLIVQIFYYHQEVKEAVGYEKPIRLIQLYENRTGEYCVCYPNLKSIKIINITPS